MTTRPAPDAARRQLVALVWLYLVLLLVEGALRKWLMPAYSDALLIVRDPVALAIAVLGAQAGALPRGRPMTALVAIMLAFLALGALQLVSGVIDSFAVVAFGLRTYFLHAFVAFVMARVLDARDVRRLVVALMLVALPMAVLMVRQFESGPAAWVNVGAGGHVEGQIVSALGRVRPAGTFSFISGPIALFSLVLAALLSAHVDLRGVARWLRLVAWAGLALATMVSGSRSLVANLALVGLAALVGSHRFPAATRGLAVAAVTATLAVQALGTLEAVQDGTDILRVRFNESSGQGIAGRLSYDYLSLLTTLGEAPVAGVGIGSGTNAGAALLGARPSLRPEGEWPRVIAEVGPVLGLIYIAWRAWLAMAVGRAALRAASAGGLLPLLLFGSCVSSLLFGQWAQPTTQGFCVFTAGLSLAASRQVLLGSLQRKQMRAVAFYQARVRPEPVDA